MHVNAKKTAVSGLLMALSVLLLVLSGVLDFSTLFFLAAAAFFVGIIIKEYGLGYGAAFFTGCTILGFLLAPQKLYCITYAMMGIYVLGVEALWQYLGKHPTWNHRKMIFAGELSEKLILVFLLGGQAALFVYDKAYEYFLVQMWGQVREKLFK